MKKGSTKKPGRATNTEKKIQKLEKHFKQCKEVRQILV